MTERQEVIAKSTANNIHKKLLPYLMSADDGMAVRSILMDELTWHDRHSHPDDARFRSICLIALCAGLVGVGIGALAPF